MFKEYPHPDIPAATAPKVDKHVVDFLGKCFLKDRDSELLKIQAAVLGINCKATSSFLEKTS